MLHPVEPFSYLDLHCGRERIWIIQRSRLHVHQSGKNCGIAVEQAAPAVGAETAHRGTR